MDLRMVKTRNRIKTAFLSLRERMMPEKIRVKDLCEEANINKTTFYNHYADSDALSDEIDENAIDMVLSEFDGHDQLLKNPRAYIMELFRALERESSHLRRVFRGKQDVLCVKLENRLHRACDTDETSPEDKMRISFAIGGFIRIVRDYLFTSPKLNIDQLADSTVHLFEALLTPAKIKE